MTELKKSGGININIETDLIAEIVITLPVNIIVLHWTF